MILDFFKGFVNIFFIKLGISIIFSSIIFKNSKEKICIVRSYCKPSKSVDLYKYLFEFLEKKDTVCFQVFNKKKYTKVFVRL